MALSRGSVAFAEGQADKTVTIDLTDVAEGWLTLELGGVGDGES